VTERDTLDLVLREFGDNEIYDRVEAELEAGQLTLNEVIAAEFETVTAPLDEVVPYVVEHARVRPGFAELARARHPLIVSSGFHELIEPLLEREGVLGEVELRANRVDVRPDGWRVIFRDVRTCSVCGERCKRGDLPDGEVVYAGDGYSDYCASLAADRVYATGSLARYLDERGVAHEPLEDFRALL
jgi:2-hydroxy-3-keto-5-methylthiopentenyl-1-phosphate phosphatase